MSIPARDRICRQLLPLLLISMALAFDPPPAAGREGLLFILDSSGSMWGRVDHEPKTVTAKKILATLLQELPADMEAGLMTYGHRRKADCADIEVISPLGTAPGEIGGRMNRLNALGKTPISDALVAAGKQLEGREDQTTVVLISDGIETCQGDPCAIAGQLKSQGVKLVLHAVGFDVDDKAAKQLACIAEAGGGRYFQADTVDQLQASLNQVKEAAVTKAPLPPPPPPPDAGTVATSTVQSKTLRIAGPGTVILKPAPWVTIPPRAWSLTDIESGEVKGSASEGQIRVGAGSYQILWRQSEHGHTDTQLTELIEVAAGKTTEAAIDTGLRVSLPEGMSAPYWWGLVMPGEQEPFWRSRLVGVGEVVPAGVYQLWWQQEQHGAKPLMLREITIEGGKLNEAILDGGINPRPAEWLAKDVYYFGLRTGDGALLGSWNRLAPQLAPAGDSELVLRPTEHNHGDIVWGNVSIGTKGFAEVNIDSGLKFNHPPDARPPYRIILVNLDDKREIVASETWDPLPVPPGRYRLDWHEQQHGTTRQTLAEEFVVESGTLVEVDL